MTLSEKVLHLPNRSRNHCCIPFRNSHEHTCHLCEKRKLFRIHHLECSHLMLRKSAVSSNPQASLYRQMTPSAQAILLSEARVGGRELFEAIPSNK